MKKALKLWRKPLSFVLALCMLMSAMTVGLTVFASDVAESRESSSGKSSEGSKDLGLSGGFQAYPDLFASWGDLPDANKWMWIDGKGPGRNGSYTAIQGLNRDRIWEYMADLILDNFDFLYSTFNDEKMPGNYWTNAANYNITDDANYTITQLLRLYYVQFGYWQAWTQNFTQNNQSTAIYYLNKTAEGELIELMKKLKDKADTGKYQMSDGTPITVEMVSYKDVSQALNYNNYLNKAPAHANLVEKMLMLFNGYNHKNTNGNLFDNFDYTADWKFTVNAPADKSYLTHYPTIADIPDGGVSTQSVLQNSTRNTGNFWGKKWNVQDAGTGVFDNYYGKTGPLNKDKDTTSKSALTEFQNLFTNELLNVADIHNVNSYTAAQFGAILSSGESVLAGIEGMSASVAEHFFAKATDIFLEDPFTRAKNIVTAVKQIVQSAYDNYQSKMTEADTKYGDQVVLTIDDLDPLKALLDSALVDFVLLNDTQQSEEVIVAAKAKYDTLLQKYNDNKKPLFEAALPEKISQLYDAMKQSVTIDGKEYKIKDFINADTKDVIYDNIPEQGQGFIKTVADLYYLVSRIAIECYTTSPTGLNVEGIFDKIMSKMIDPDSRPVNYSKVEFEAFGMEGILKGVGQVNQATGNFSVTSNPLLYTYNNISEIPDEILKVRTVYSIALDENGKIKSDSQITQKTFQESDKKAKSAFNLWATNFDVVSRTEDLSKLDATGLKIAFEKANAAVKAVASYDDMVKTHLLQIVFGYSFAEGQSRLSDITASVVSNFTTRANTFIAKYSPMEELADDEAYIEFFVKYDEAVALYDLIENKTPALETLRTKIEDLRRFLSDMREYLELCKKMEAYYVSGTTSIVPFTSKNITNAKALFKQMNDLYSGLSDRSLAYDDVKAAKKLQDAFEDAINAYFAAPIWQETSVSYDGVENATPENLRKIISNIDKIFSTDMLGSLLGSPEGTATNEALYEMLTSALYTDTVPTEIVKMFGPAVLAAAAGQESLVGLVGLYIYPNTVADKIGDYPKVQAALKAAGQDWNAVKWEDLIWTTIDKKTGKEITIAEGGDEAFVQAIGAALAPFWKVVQALLNNAAIKAPIIGTVVLAGYPGLNNVVFPMLKQLGVGVNQNVPATDWKAVYCKPYTLPVGGNYSYGGGYVNPQDLVNLGADSYNYMARLLLPLLDWVKNTALKNPVETVSKVLPILSEMLSSNRIEEGLYKLTGPLGPDIVNGLTSTMDLSNINALIKSFLPEGKLTLPNGVSIQLPEIDQGLLAGLAKQKFKTDVGNQDITNGYSKAYNNGTNMVKGIALDTSETYDQSFFYLLQYVVGMLKDNKAELASLAGTGTPLADVLNTILEKDDKQIINTLIGLFLDLGDIEDTDWDMSDWKNIVETNVNYGNTTNAKAKKAIEEVDALVKVLMKELLDTDMTSIIGDNLYTDKNLNDFVMTIYRLLGTDEIAPILKLLGIDVSISSVADNLSAYPKVADYLKNTKIEVTDEDGNVSQKPLTWANADLTGLDWEIPEDETASNYFATALARILKAFNPLLKTIITGEDLPLAGGVLTLKGANGYANAILPVLKALGANAMSPEDYTKFITEKGDDAILVGIIAPVLEKAEELMASPVDTLANMLPNLGYFLDNGGFTKALNALILPITNVTDQIMPLLADENGKEPALFDFVLEMLGDTIPANIKDIIDIVDFNNLDASIIPIAQKVLSDLWIGEKQLNIVLPDIKWGNVAGLGERVSDNGMWKTALSKLGSNPTTYHVEADTGATVMHVLNYLFTAVKANQDTIVQMLSELDLGDMKETVLSLVKQILANEPEKMSSAIINVLVAASENPADDDWDMSDFAFKTSQKLYKSADEQRIKETIVNADLLINNASSIFLLDGGTLKTLVAGMFSDDTAKQLFTTIYTMLDSETITPIFEKLGIDASPKALKNALAGFGNVSHVIGTNTTWADVFASPMWATASFGVVDTDTFAKALAASFSPFEDILKAILVGENFNAMDIYKIKGANGYKNSILPILSALGVTTADGVLSADEYAGAVDGGELTLYNIIKPVLNTVLRATSSPVDFLTSMLPNFAYFMDNGGLTRSVYNLLKPLTNITDQLLPLFEKDGVTPSIQDLALELLSKFVPDFALPEGLNLSSIETSIIPLVNGFIKSMGLTLPDIDWSKLAGRGTVETSSIFGKNGKIVKADKQDVFYAVLDYVALIPTYADNKAGIEALLGDANTGIVAEIVDNLTGKKPVDLATILVDLFSPNSDGLSRNWTFKAIKSLAPQYTANLSEQDFSDGITALDALIPSLLGQFAGGATVKTLVSDGVYTNAMVNTIAGAIFGLFAPYEMDEILVYLSEFGIDLSTTGVAGHLVESKYKSVRNAFASAGRWAYVDFENLNWGFKDGDQDGFLGAIVALLRPVSNVLEALLNGKDITLLDSVTIRGGEGYNNAIIPLLEALGCSGVLTEKQYKESVKQNQDNALLSVLKPLFARINELLDAPIGTLTSILPNLGYFMYNDGLAQLMESFLLPISKVLNTVEPIYDVNLNGILEPIANIDVVKTVNDALAGVKVGDDLLGIKLPSFSWERMAGMGQAVDFVSSQIDEDGNYVTARKIVSNQPQAFAETLRYVISVIQDKDNYAAITKLVSGLDLGSLGDIVMPLLDSIATADVDSVIEMLFASLLGIGVEEDEPGNTTKPSQSTTTTTTKPTTTTQPSTTNPTTKAPSTQAPVTQPAEDGNGVNLPLIIGLSVGGVLLLAAIAAAIIIIRKKKMAQ